MRLLFHIRQPIVLQNVQNGLVLLSLDSQPMFFPAKAKSDGLLDDATPLTTTTNESSTANIYVFGQSIDRFFPLNHQAKSSRKLQNSPPPRRVLN
jgi:hypothetical protein